MKYMHLENLEYMLHYQAPPGRVHKPRPIKPGFEEIEVIVSGYGDFINGKQKVRFGPGTSVWYYENEVVEVVADIKEPYETIVFCYKINGIPEKRSPFFSAWESALSCSCFCQQALRSYQTGDIDLEFLMVCSYTRLLWEVREFERNKQQYQVPLQVMKAIDYINTYFDDAIQVADIAHAAGVSNSHLHLLFREYIQTSPIQYLLKKRLSKAQELLTKSELSVKQVCFESGFNDIKNFCSYFKRVNKLTPSQYRKLTFGR